MNTWKSALAALFYAVASFLITVSNKTVLTTYKFPSVQALAVGQLAISIIIIQMARRLKLIKVEPFRVSKAWELKELMIIYFGNLLFGLGGTKSLSLPMFTVLRRFSTLMTLYGELFFLRAKKPGVIILSVWAMVIGSVIAASDDLSFDLHGYVFIMLNNFFTAANGVYAKKNLDKKRNHSEYEILMYTSAFSILPMVALLSFSGEIDQIRKFEGLGDASFWLFFLLSSVMGFILNYSWMLCTNLNNPLTTSVIGCFKNIFVTYVGMFIGGDYIFSILNFTGLTISSAASLVYTYCVLYPPKVVPARVISLDRGALKKENRHPSFVHLASASNLAAQATLISDSLSALAAHSSPVSHSAFSACRRAARLAWPTGPSEISQHLANLLTRTSKTFPSSKTYLADLKKTSTKNQLSNNLL